MVEQVLEQATRMGALRAIALCRCFSGALDFQTGHWVKAEADLREGIDLYRKLSGASGESLSLQRLGVLLTARGRLDEAMAVFDEGVFAAERATMRSHCLTRLYASMARNRLAAGDTKPAVQYMQQGDLTAERHGHCVTCNALLLPEAVRVALVRGEHHEAENRAARLEQIAGEFGSAAWKAMAHQARARVLATAGSAHAAAEFLAAHDAFTAIDAVYDAARCLLGASEAHRQRGDLARADSLAADAAATFQRLGAPGIET
jgi:tetratricopeptide (TPR) repeat protein